MDLATALAISARALELDPTRLRAIAASLAHEDATARPARGRPTVRRSGTNGTASNSGAHAAADRDTLRATWTVLNRTLELLR